MTNRYRLLIPESCYQSMVAHAIAELPNECCGYLAGRLEGAVGTVSKQVPLRNAAASPIEYEAEPRDLLQAHRMMRIEGLEHLAVYHSHPTSAPRPSRKDLERNPFDSMIHLIISLAGSQPEVQAWFLGTETFEPAQWDFAESNET